MDRTITYNDVTIGSMQFSNKHKPCLVIKKGHVCNIYGYFKNDDNANAFMLELVNFINMSKRCIRSGVMEYEEALKSVIEDGINLGGYGDYIDPEALPLCAKALEKQIPKKPICKIYKSDNIYLGTSESYFCPTCNNGLIWINDKYCKDCGQALNWSD